MGAGAGASSSSSSALLGTADFSHRHHLNYLRDLELLQGQHQSDMQHSSSSLLGDDEYLRSHLLAQDKDYTKFKEAYLSTLVTSGDSGGDVMSRSKNLLDEDFDAYLWSKNSRSGMPSESERNYNRNNNISSSYIGGGRSYDIPFDGDSHHSSSINNHHNSSSSTYSDCVGENNGIDYRYDNDDYDEEDDDPVHMQQWFRAVVGCTGATARENSDRCFSAGISSVTSLLGKVKQSVTIDRSGGCALLDLLVLDNYQKQLIISQSTRNKVSNINMLLASQQSSSVSTTFGHRSPHSYNMETAIEMMSMLDSAYRTSQALSMANNLNIPISSSIMGLGLGNAQLYSDDSQNQRQHHRPFGIGTSLDDDIRDDIDFISRSEDDIYSGIDGARRQAVTDEIASHWVVPMSAPVLHFSDDRASVWRNGSVGYFPKALYLVQAQVSMMSLRMDRAPMRNNYFSFGASTLDALAAENGSGLFGDKPGSWGLISRRNDPTQRLEMWGEGNKKCVLEDTMREGDMLSILFDATTSSCTFFLNDQMIYIFDNLLSSSSSPSLQEHLPAVHRGVASRNANLGQVVLGAVVCDDHCVSIMPDYCKEHFSNYFVAIDSSHKDLASMTTPSSSQVNSRASVNLDLPPPTSEHSSPSSRPRVSTNSRHNRERLNRALEIIDGVNSYENIDRFYDDLGLELANPNPNPNRASARNDATTTTTGGEVVSGGASSAYIRNLIRHSPAVTTALATTTSGSTTIRATPVPATFPRANSLLQVPVSRPAVSNSAGNSTVAAAINNANLVKNASSVSNSSSGNGNGDTASSSSSGEGKSADGANSSCCVCWDADKCVVLFPCRHMCLCERCGLHNELLVTSCPMCRQPIEQRFKVFT